MSEFNKITAEIKNNENPERAKHSNRFFKTKRGEYGAGDIFLGLSVPLSRSISKKYYKETDFEDLQKLLDSKYHEHRLIALFILELKFNKTKSDLETKKIYNFYIKNVNKNNINNWDLVDASAYKIAGKYLLNNNRDILYKFAESNNLWKKRVAIISTLTFIKENQFIDTIKISEILLNDNHDLIHKAVGWMLREAGKRDIDVLYKFLDKHSTAMPRTSLRYAIEKLPEKKRLYYLNK